MYIVYKNSLKNALEKWYDEAIFAEMMDETNAISETIYKAKKAKQNAGITNYARIPHQYFMPFFKQNENDMYDRLFVLIAGYIVTFCGTYKRIKIDNICKITNIERETLINYIQEHGSQYGLSYLREKDRFRRINKYIVLNISDIGKTTSQN